MNFHFASFMPLSRGMCWCLCCSHTNHIKRQAVQANGVSLCGTFLNYSRRRGSTRGGGGAMKKRTGTFALRLLFQRFQFSSTNQRWHAFSSAALRQFHFPPFFSLLFMWWTCTQKGKLVEPFSSCCEYVIISNARRLDAAEREAIFVRRRSSSIWNPPSKKK